MGIAARAKKILGKDDILNSDDIKTEPVDVPEWYGVVLVRALTGVQRDEFEESLVERKGKGRKQTQQIRFSNLRAKLVAQCIVGEDNKRVFSDTDIVALGRKSSAALDRVFTVAQRLSGMSSEDIEEMTADLDSTASGDSP